MIIVKGVLILATSLVWASCEGNNHNGNESIKRNDSAYQLDIKLEGSLQNPAFSPDGNSIVFTRFQNGYNKAPADIFIFNIATKKLTEIVSNGAENINLPGSAWHHNKIVYSSSEGKHDEIYIIDQDGKNKRQLTNRKNFMAYEPSFSPDGKTIVFESHPLNVEAGGVITRYSLDGSSDYTALTSNGEDAREPNWSPEGSKILYQKFEGGQWDIWTIDSDGSNEVKITQGKGDKTDASFSNNGKTVIYSADYGLDYANIFQLNLHDSTIEQLTNYKNGYDGAVSISPDGKRLVFESSVGDPDESNGTKIWMLAK